MPPNRPPRRRRRPAQTKPSRVPLGQRLLGAVKRRPWILGTFVVAAAAAGHWAYHYAPRVRPAVASGPGAAILDIPWAEAAVWLPYPHQNLAALEKQAGLVSSSGRDVLALAEVETPRLPTFGGMLSPPARSLALATGKRGELAVAMDIYPSFAAFAQLAGKLAKNPWLAGGDVEWQGRKIQVAWRDGLWLAGSPKLPNLAPKDEPGIAPSLVVAHVSRPSEPLPAGRYRLRVEGGDLVVRSASAEDPSSAEGRLEPPPLEASGALLLVVEEGAMADDQARGLALFSQSSSALTELPRAASLHRSDRRFKLPAESLLELAGHGLLEGEVGGYRLLATDRQALEGAALLAGPLGDRLEGRILPEMELWLRLSPAAREMTRITGGLEQAPFISKRRLQRWQSAERLLDVLSGHYGDLHLEVSQRGALVLTLERSGPKS